MGLGQTYPISRYELRGNTALPPDAADGVLTNAIGPAVSLESVCHVLVALRRAYQERGYVHVRVSLPEQSLVGGVVAVDVAEGELAADSISLPVQSNLPPVMKFEVRHFAVTGNTLLRQEEIDGILQPVTGPAVSLDDLRQAAINLRRAYR
jgi:hemolysin activation/secretion protein